MQHLLYTPDKVMYTCLFCIMTLFKYSPMGFADNNKNRVIIYISNDGIPLWTMYYCQPLLCYLPNAPGSNSNVCFPQPVFS